jgi:hypothetical protein
MLIYLLGILGYLIGDGFTTMYKVMFYVQIVYFILLSIIALIVSTSIGGVVGKSIFGTNSGTIFSIAVSNVLITSYILLFSAVKLALLWYIMTNVGTTGMTGSTLFAAITHIILTVIFWFKKLAS